MSVDHAPGAAADSDPSATSFTADALLAALHDAGITPEARGTLPALLTGVADDSRAVVPGCVFIAIRGSAGDGHTFLPEAMRLGAALAIVEPSARVPDGLPVLVVRDTRRAAPIAAAVAFRFPSRELRLAAVTGTNGKTTTVSMLRHLLDQPAARSASVGTLGVLVGSEGREVEGGGGLTTPGPVELQRVLRALVDQGVGFVAMETSSHSLHQRRIAGVQFDVAIFTNLTRDHLDYHGSMDAYFKAKAMLLDALRPHGVVVVNLDDPAWRALDTQRRRLGVSERLMSAEIHAEDIVCGARGSAWILALGVERHAVRLPLIGDFNIANALVAAAAAFGLGVDGERIAARLSTMPQIPGRLEIIHEQPTVLRDYAHTPDALARALDAVRPFVDGRLITVFGCGGDRDPGKRPVMGRIAAEKSDVVIVTSDNPRTENPERIIDEIETGMPGQHERITDRRDAIARALAVARPEDVVMLAGKGHETYQVRGTEKLPFDERAIVAELTAKRAAGDAV